MIAPFKPHLAGLTEIRVNRDCEFIRPGIAQIIEEAIDGYMETKQQLELDILGNYSPELVYRPSDERATIAAAS